MIILGEGEEKNYIEEIIKKLSLTDSVFLQGFENNVFNYLNNAKCLVMPSLYENPGHVLIEAAACNCPIISSDCPTGPREILKNGKLGMLFLPKDEKSLANKILKYKSNKRKYNNIALNAYNSLGRFDYRSNCEKYYKIIKKYI